jgi:hypothetical protein
MTLDRTGRECHGNAPAEALDAPERWGDVRALFAGGSR